MEQRGSYNIIFEELDRLQSEIKGIDTQSFEITPAELDVVKELMEIVHEVSEVPRTFFTTT